MRYVIVCLAAACLAGTAPAQYCASPTYCPPAKTYNYGYTPSYTYTAPTYSYHAAGYWNGRWYPAGYYAWINNCWYRQGYGIEYGLAAAPAYCPPVMTPSPADTSAALLQAQNDFLFKLLVTAQHTQLQGLQPVAPVVPPTTITLTAPPAAGLTAEEVARLKLLLSQVPAQPAPPVVPPTK